jgi:hypothetical protein
VSSLIGDKTVFESLNENGIEYSLLSFVSSQVLGILRMLLSSLQQTGYGREKAKAEDWEYLSNVLSAHFTEFEISQSLLRTKHGLK